MSITTLNSQSGINSIDTKNQVKTDNINKKNKAASYAKIGLGVGLTCLAASGIYIASGKTQNVAKIYEKIKNSESIMDTLKGSKLSKTKFKELMFKITNNEEMSEKFINEVTLNPRKSKEYTQLLNKKFGSDKALLDWMLQPGGYQEAYYKHSHKIYNEAKKPDDLIGISPNWNIWVMKNKFGQDFSFGELPTEFENVDKYREIFNSALHNPNTGYEHSGIKFNEYIIGGLSGKSIRKIEIGDKKYILKFQPKTDNIDLNDNISMKSDSTFLNAQLERYLSLHKYEQGPKLKFYDYKTNSALYEITEGTKPDANSIHDIVKINKELDSLNELGVYYNDLNQSNFLINNGKLNFIDSGESSYIDFFKPGVTSLHFTLPNLNGRSITESASAIILAK